jgi:hypothetical protein
MRPSGCGFISDSATRSARCNNAPYARLRGLVALHLYLRKVLVFKHLFYQHCVPRTSPNTATSKPYDVSSPSGARLDSRPGPHAATVGSDARTHDSALPTLAFGIVNPPRPASAQ